ncbi:Lysine methyltransferase [Arabidopsis suecica]|uniref:Lysine methyltransferase n=1 Tax=Arabidopsis suecica TaxID=45249 RepID=A0A8T2HMG3_ARASU|nr:Lysine methyltransferase [Arabidopsis suecica]
MEEDSEIEVMSEIHLGCPPAATNDPFLSRFTFSFPSNTVSVDKDGDLLLPRRNYPTGPSFTVTIQHSITSNLRHVGLQVWKAQLVLSEFVLHKICTSSDFHGIVCLELGAGTGLLGILLARVAKAIFLTDHGDEILGNCAKNLELNSSLFHPHNVVNVRELNWMSDWPIQDTHALSPLFMSSYCWNKQDFELVKCASFIFAADVIYSDDLTIALFSMLRRVMSFGCDKVLYLGLEKRYNFSLDDLNVVANGYTCFRSYVKEDEIGKQEKRSFVGKRIDVTQIPHYLKDYDRGEDVELWEIKYVLRLKFQCLI